MPLPRYTPLEKLKELHAKILFSQTDKVSKITDGSVVNALIYANAKLSQKALKDISVTAAHIFPDTAYGDQLDAIARDRGLAGRYGASGSSMYVRFFADPGTTYSAFGHEVSTDEGITFSLVEDVTVGAFGFAYGLCRSDDTGASANVSAYSVSSLGSAPTGHREAINEYAAWGGRDRESDDDFRVRIKDAFNICSQGTYASLTLALQEIDPRVLRVMSHGMGATGKLTLAVVSRTGAPYTPQELINLRERAFEHMSMSETDVYYLANRGVEFVNVEWFPVDISMRARLSADYDVDAVRRRIHANITKLFDPREWDLSRRVEWDDILGAVKGTAGVEYVADSSFLPRTDMRVTPGHLPRVRMFEMRDLGGDLIFSASDKLSPVDYEQYRDYDYLANVIRAI